MENAIILTLTRGDISIRIEVPQDGAPELMIPIDKPQYFSDAIRKLSKSLRGTGIEEEKKEQATGELLHPDDSEPNNRGAMYIGGRIRRMMELRPSIKYGDFVIAGISSSSFGHMRKNAARATRESIAKIATVIGLTAEEFLGGKTISFPAGPSGMPKNIEIKDEEEAPDPEPAPVVQGKAAENVVPFAP